MNNNGQFKKGRTPWNKGLKGVNGVSSTTFRDGKYVGPEHPSWKGGIQKNKTDCAHLWDGNGKRKRRPKAVYEEANGPIPKGFIIYHIDGDKDNDSIENLECISRAELLKRNLNKNKQTE